MMHIRAAAPHDADPWLGMRCALWPGSIEDHRAAVERFFTGHRHDPAEVFLALDDRGTVLGFVELSIRNIVDGCATDRVAYLEGWYVAPQARRRRVGAALIEAAERWALQQGCTEFGSDCDLDNQASHHAHRALGFEETGRVVNFRKDLVQR